MTRPTAVFRLHVAVAFLGAAATAAALLAAARSVSFALPAPERMLAACRAFALPRPSASAVAALALGSLAFLVVGLAARSVVRQLRAGRRFAHALAVIERRQVAGERILVFACDDVQAFCVGLLRARIYVSSGALAALADAELRAVVAHEAHHARYHDPLRIFFARMLGESLFFLPALRRLGQDYASLAEVAADGAAIRASRGDVRPLAAALMSFGGTANPAAVAIAPERVDHLLGERPAWHLPLALLAWAGVVVAAIVVVAHRTADATSMAPLNVPLLAAQSCMLAMAVVPLMAGAAALFAAGKAVRRGTH